MTNTKSNSIISYILQLLIITLIISLSLNCDEDDNNGYTGPWVEVPTPGGCGHLNACYFNSSDDGWACGSRGDSPYPVLIHWNGVEWEEYPYGGWFDGEEFYLIEIFDISFSSPDDGWCVGWLGVEMGGEFFGFILRYDGKKWYLFRSHFGWSVKNVYCISEDDVWFVVCEKNSGYFLYHWDGEELDNEFSCSAICDLAFSSSTEGLAVGWYYSVYHWDGMKWEQIWKDTSRPEPHNAVSYYEPDKAWIVGDERRGKWINGEYTYWYEWDYFYNDVHFSAYDNGWMLGYYPIDEHQGVPCTWYWDGSSWTAIYGPEDMRGRSIFVIDKEDVWIVGKNKEGPVCSSWHYEK